MQEPEERLRLPNEKHHLDEEPDGLPSQPHESPLAGGLTYGMEHVGRKEGKHDGLEEREQAYLVQHLVLVLWTIKGRHAHSLPGVQATIGRDALHERVTSRPRLCDQCRCFGESYDSLAFKRLSLSRMNCLISSALSSRRSHCS